MTVWTNEWAGARVLSLFAARAPGRLAVPLLSWEILEEKRAGAGGAVASRATAEPATGPRWLSPNAPCFSHPHALPNIAFFFFPAGEAVSFCFLGQVPIRAPRSSFESGLFHVIGILGEECDLSEPKGARPF